MKEFYPKVSIIIPVYTNDNNSLKRAIDSDSKELVKSKYLLTIEEI